MTKARHAKAKFALNTSDGGQQTGCVNGCEEYASCPPANKHIIFKSAQWCQVAWDDLSLQRVAGLL